ncbi:4-hydroxythreonine-4-phosphate dehydrogenase PdxA [bacterium]|nr:4-hydroxythreonine-4-phosphate dehydrogenase PdxA [bacterium]
MKRPIIGITMGDAAGIGPEIIIKALSTAKIYKYCFPIVIGDARVMEFYIKKYKVKKKINLIADCKALQFKPGVINIIDKQNIHLNRLKIGKIQKMCGRASVEYVKEGIKLALGKQIQGIVTAPLCKEAMHKAGFFFAGHTELFAQKTSSKTYAMMFVGKKLKVILVTTHLALKEVPLKINKKIVLDKIKLAYEILKKLKVKQPRLVVCGLNPHAGESGLFGKEEKDSIIPACQKARQLGIKVFGPYSADTVFYYANKGKFDIVIAMYHDQGLIPVKLLDFSFCVNVTLGLPFVRTSPGHGTAFDIAGKNIANPSGLVEAIYLAAKLAI